MNTLREENQASIRQQEIATAAEVQELNAQLLPLRAASEAASADTARLQVSSFLQPNWCK